MVTSNPKLKKSDAPKGWELVENHFEKSIYPKLKLIGRIWREDSGLWRPKFEAHGAGSMDVWSASQAWGPYQKTPKAAAAWIKKNAPKIRKKILKVMAQEKKRLGCGCP